MIALDNPTGRKTEAHVLTLGQHKLFFSYQTLIAYRGPSADGYCRLRIANSWGPTTGRHFSELGCANFLEVSEEKLAEVVHGIVR